MFFPMAATAYRLPLPVRNIPPPTGRAHLRVFARGGIMGWISMAQREGCGYEEGLFGTRYRICCADICRRGVCPAQRRSGKCGICRDPKRVRPRLLQRLSRREMTDSPFIPEETGRRRARAPAPHRRRREQVKCFWKKSGSWWPNMAAG